MSSSTQSNLKPSRIKKKHSKKNKHKTNSTKKSSKIKNTTQYIPQRSEEITKNISKINDKHFVHNNRALIDKPQHLFGGRSWNQKIYQHASRYQHTLDIKFEGCVPRMSASKDKNTTDNEFKSMLARSDNNYIHIMSDIFDGYLNGIRTILEIILLYKGRHLLPIRCHIDLLPYFYVGLRHYAPRKKLWNKAVKDTETGMVTVDWSPDENIFVIEDIYDEWKTHIMNELLLRKNVNEEAIFYIADGDIFMSIHSNIDKNNTLLQKNIFTRLYIEALSNFDDDEKYAFGVDLAGINYYFFERYHVENSWGSRSRCWDGDGLVLLADGTKKYMKELCIGDDVAVLQRLPYDVVTGYKKAKVTVKIESVVNRKYDMVYVDNKLWITPYHAVLMMGGDGKEGLKWKMPCDLNKIEQRFVTSIYNFILDGGHVLNVNGIWANTLGHDLTGDVIEHPFWGNSDAMNDYWSQKEGYPDVVEYI